MLNLQRIPPLASLLTVLAMQGCRDEARPPPAPLVTPTATNSADDDRIRKAKDERARRRELEGDAGAVLPQEPMQSAPIH
jgi:hypothetical protein